MAASAYFLDLTAASPTIVDPENAVDGVATFLQIDSFSWGVHNASGGQAAWSDMHFSGATSGAGPLLMAACAQQLPIPTAVLNIQTTAGGQTTWIKITLSTVLVTSYQSGGSGSGGNIAPADQFSLSYGQIDYSYTPQNPSGAAIEVKYDTTSNKPC